MKEFKQFKGLEVRESAIHARGCFATLPIRKGTRILEYTGRRISVTEANNRYYERPNTYLFSLSDGRTVIDGIGMASMINHCCEPNCQASEEAGRVFFISLRAIAAGEELTIDYMLGNSNEREAPCRCGSAKCRGSMYSPQELLRREQRQAARSDG
jgi:uncharacterized protein